MSSGWELSDLAVKDFLDVHYRCVILLSIWPTRDRRHIKIGFKTFGNVGLESTIAEPLFRDIRGQIPEFIPYAARKRANFACTVPTNPCGRKMMNTTSSVP